MSLIFVSYRKNDSTDIAGRITADLARIFGRDQIFQDAINILAGEDWRHVLDERLAQTGVMVVLIGAQWNPPVDDQGTRRLDEPTDWVAYEVSKGLAQPQTLVIPVCIHNAPMPKEADLPEALRPLLKRQYIEIRENPYYDDDLKRLVSRIGDRISRRSGQPELSVGEQLALLRDQDERLKAYRSRVSLQLRQRVQQAEAEQEARRDAGLQQGSVRSLILMVFGLIAGLGVGFAIAQGGNLPFGIAIGLIIFVVCLWIGRAAPPAGPSPDVIPTPEIARLRSTLARIDEQIERNATQREQLQHAHLPSQTTRR